MEVLLWAPIFPAAFIGLWAFVMFLLSRVSGWNQLARYYAYDGPAPQTLRRGQSASIGLSTWFPVRYRATLNVGAGDGALYLRPMVLFRLFQPALSIPVSEISREERPGVILRLASLRAEKETGVVILIRPALADWVEAQAGPFSSR